MNPSIPIAAVLLTTVSTRAWLEAWTDDQRAYALGWRPAYAADVTPDGRILLAWDDFAELGADFEACCEALARSWAKHQANFATSALHLADRADRQDETGRGDRLPARGAKP